MSRTGKKPVAIPANVTATLEGGLVSIKGPKGALSIPMVYAVTYTLEDGKLSVKACSGR
jgi:large subunit ribosomal protein L6